MENNSVTLIERLDRSQFWSILMVVYLKKTLENHRRLQYMSLPWLKNLYTATLEGTDVKKLTKTQVLSKTFSPMKD